MKVTLKILEDNLRNSFCCRDSSVSSDIHRVSEADYSASKVGRLEVTSESVSLRFKLSVCIRERVNDSAFQYSSIKEETGLVKNTFTELLKQSKTP